MFAAIRYYQAEPDSIDEVVEKIQEGFVPLVREMAGFVSYFVLHPGEREHVLISVSVFNDRQSAEESNQKATDWVQNHVSDLLVAPEFAAGEVVVYEVGS